MNQRALTHASAGSSGPNLALSGTVEPWRDPEWQRLWLSIAAKPWRSLALVPASVGAGDEFTLEVAVTLARTGMVHIANPIQVADATHIPLSDLNSFLLEVNRGTSGGHRILVALPPTTQSPVTAAIAQSLDGALLCVLLDRMSWAQSKKTIKTIGTSRFLGSVVLHQDQLPSK